MKKILVVEDDALRIGTFREQLESYTVHVAISVEEAKEHLQQTNYDLLFLDHDLEFGERVYINPEEADTGYQLAKWISGKKKFSKIPIVVHSFNWFGANRMVRILENAVYIPFGLYPLQEVAHLFLENKLDPKLSNLGNVMKECRIGVDPDEED
ncbi:MAG: response regulator [Planctomycetota bacterium]|jgi:CheY-like chemotaxis protein|nr:response regulator [Planctomycetota bacterium]